MTTPWSHRIKGTHKTKGKRGDIIQYEPSEKVPLAVKLAIADHFRAKGFSPAVIDPIKIDEFTCNKKGDLLKKVFQNNTYSATGQITYFLREHTADVAHEKQTNPFSIKFEDALDEHGTPLMKVTNFELK
jgi:hypothetical protein